MGKTEKSTYNILKYFQSCFIPIDDTNGNPFFNLCFGILST